MNSCVTEGQKNVNFQYFYDFLTIITKIWTGSVRLYMFEEFKNKHLLLLDHLQVRGLVNAAQIFQLFLVEGLLISLEIYWSNKIILFSQPG